MAKTVRACLVSSLLLVFAAMPATQDKTPFITLVDVTAQTGIDFRHENSPTTHKYLIETMGGGVAVFDYDNDGWLDVFFVNGAALKSPQLDSQAPDKSAPAFWN